MKRKIEIQYLISISSKQSTNDSLVYFCIEMVIVWDPEVDGVSFGSIAASNQLLLFTNKKFISHIRYNNIFC